MKQIVKKNLIAITAVICCIVVAGSGVWCSAVCKSSPCTQVCIVVKDSVKRQFVDAFELEYYLKRHACYPQGDSMRIVDCHAIEQCLLKPREQAFPASPALSPRSSRPPPVPALPAYPTAGTGVRWRESAGLPAAKAPPPAQPAAPRWFSFPHACVR